MVKKKAPTGHVRRGKKLVPELLAQFPMTFVRHADVVLPELIPIALLHSFIGPREANEAAHDLLTIVRAVNERRSLLASDLELLTTKEVKSLRSRLREAFRLKDIVASAFAPLTTLIPKSPLSAFETLVLDRGAAERRLTDCIEGIFFRENIQTSRVLATLYYIEARAGRLKIADTMQLPDLEALYSDPEGEAAQRAASEVRMFSLMKVGHRHEQTRTDWPERFWHAGRSIGPCEFAEAND
jgi:hypothetical protein